MKKAAMSFRPSRGLLPEWITAKTKTRLRIALVWFLKTVLYTWLAPWTLIAAYVTIVRPSGEDLRQFFIDLATRPPAAWAQAPADWSGICFVVRLGFLVMWLPCSPIAKWAGEWLDQRVGRIGDQVAGFWTRLSGATRFGAKVVAAALIICLGVGALLGVRHLHASGRKLAAGAPVLPEAPSQQASAAIALPNGTMLSGDAQIEQKSDSIYAVRFLKAK